MNPENQPIAPTPEHIPSGKTPESIDSVLQASPEIIQPGVERGAEAKEAATEARSVASDAFRATGVAPAVPAIPSIPAPSLPPSSTQAALEAADENEIEKEWVERTQKIIASTKGDPFQREKQIVDVREEYQKKRFNRVRGDDQS